MAIKIAGIEVSVPAFAELLYSNADFAEVLHANADFADITQLGVSKDQFIRELVPLIDDLALVSTKGVVDSYAVQDAVAAAVTKLFHDSATVSESSAITATKPLHDSAILIDGITAVLNKVLFDLAVIVDAVAFVQVKHAKDIATPSDVAAITAHFNRVFTDYVAIDDFAGIDKLYNGTKHNIANISDNQIFAVAKGVSDTLSIVDYDLLTYSFAKKLRDTSIADDLHIIDVTKVLQDTYSVQEHLYKDLAKTSADNANAYDSSVLSTTKPLTEHQYLTDLHVTALTKPTAELIGATDYSTITAEKLFLDSTTPIDYPSLQPVLRKGDNIYTSEAYVFDIDKALFDTSIVSDASVYVVSKPVSEVALINDVPQVTFTHPRVDGNNISDFSAWQYTRNSKETITTSDSYYKGVVKLFYDAVAIDDAIKGPFVNFAKHNVTFTSDSYNVILNKIYKDSTTITDSPRFLYSQEHNEVISTADSNIVSYVKHNVDNVTTTELPLISVSKPVYDENVLMDNSNWVVQKNLDETAYVYDYVSITFSAGANAMFNVALFNQSTFG